MIDKIVEGKLGSYYSQVVLADQPSIRDPKMSVAEVIAAAGKTLGDALTVTRFARLKVGEASRSRTLPGFGRHDRALEAPAGSAPKLVLEAPPPVVVDAHDL